VTLAEFRDKRKIFDIEAYTRQPFTAEVIPGLEPTQRLERGRDFAPRKGGGKFDGRRGGGGGGFGGGFGGRGRPEGRGFEGRAEKRFDDRKPFNDDRQGGPRGGFAERQDFGDRKNFGDRKEFGDRSGFAAKPFGKPAASKFDDRKPRGPRQVGFEAGRTPFDKPARSAGKPSSGFDAAKKRTPKPRVAR